MPKNPLHTNFVLYSFQDRGKRFRLQQFICKHADKLFNRNIKPIREDSDRTRQLELGYYPVLPPFEWFIAVDKELRLQRFFEVSRYFLCDIMVL